MVADKKEKTISLRITPEDYDYLFVVAYMTGMTVSAYMRTVLNGCVAAVKTARKTGQLPEDQFSAILAEKKETK